MLIEVIVHEQYLYGNLVLKHNEVWYCLPESKKSWVYKRLVSGRKYTLEDDCIKNLDLANCFPKNVTVKTCRPHVCDIDHVVTIAKVLFEVKNQPSVTKLKKIWTYK